MSTVIHMSLRDVVMEPVNAAAKAGGTTATEVARRALTFYLMMSSSPAPALSVEEQNICKIAWKTLPEPPTPAKMSYAIRLRGDAWPDLVERVRHWTDTEVVAAFHAVMYAGGAK